MNTRLHFFVFLLSSLFLFSCNQEEFNLAPDARLEFAADTIIFDTIFSSIGSTTKWFTVKNPNKQAVNISNIFLAGGDKSPFRLNINGVNANEELDVDISGGDSMFVFVEVTIDPTG